MKKVIIFLYLILISVFTYSQVQIKELDEATTLTSGDKFIIQKVTDDVQYTTWGFIDAEIDPPVVDSALVADTAYYVLYDSIASLPDWLDSTHFDTMYVNVDGDTITGVIVFQDIIVLNDSAISKMYQGVILDSTKVQELLDAVDSVSYSDTASVSEYAHQSRGDFTVNDNLIFTREFANTRIDPVLSGPYGLKMYETGHDAKIEFSPYNAGSPYIKFVDDSNNDSLMLREDKLYVDEDILFEFGSELGIEKNVNLSGDNNIYNINKASGDTANFTVYQNVTDADSATHADTADHAVTSEVADSAADAGALQGISNTSNMATDTLYHAGILTPYLNATYGEIDKSVNDSILLDTDEWVITYNAGDTLNISNKTYGGDILQLLPDGGVICNSLQWALEDTSTAANKVYGNQVFNSADSIMYIYGGDDSWHSLW